MAVKAAGELFVTMAKEGSTISDLMDGFATAVSGNDACGPVKGEGEQSAFVAGHQVIGSARFG
jgi:hypothetical protein